MGTTDHSEATVVLFGRLGERQQGTNIDMHVGHCKVQGCVKQTHPVGQNLAPQEILYGHFQFFRLAVVVFGYLKASLTRPWQKKAQPCMNTIEHQPPAPTCSPGAGPRSSASVSTTAWQSKSTARRGV